MGSPDANDDRPWYADGLRFHCLPDCGRCCVNHDDYAYVYLRGSDVRNLSAHLGIEPERFLERYGFEEDGLVALRMDTPECVFLEGTRCTVYDARPTQCRTFPFWRENLRSPAAWERLRAFCPGIDEGDLHGAETIRKEIARRRPD